MQPDVKETVDRNIWLFNHYAITPDQAGGSRHYSICKILVEKGYRVTVFASGFNYQKREESKCAEHEDFKIEIKDGIRFVWVKTVPYKKNNWKRVVNMLSYTWKCLRIYKKLLGKNNNENNVEKPGIIIGSSVHLFAVWTGYRIARKLKAKFIMEVRDLWPMTLVEFRKGLKYHPFIFLLGKMDRFLAKRALRIVSVLPGAYEYYKKYGIDKERVVWIPNGVDTSLYPTEPDQPGNTAPGKPFKILYTGTFGLEASLQTLLEAAKITADNRLPVSFELVGSGEKKKELMEIRDKLGLTNVEFRDPVGKDSIPHLLCTADAYWIGTRKVENLYKYGFSFNKLFEYLAAGKPILFSINSINSINSTYNPVEESGAGITVLPGDPSALSEAILKIYNMPIDERIKMGRKGIAYAKEFHDFKILAEKFDGLFKELSINEKRRQ
jgi:glycosyltransferase involved in cell wall biosynthesis